MGTNSRMDRISLKPEGSKLNRNQQKGPHYFHFSPFLLPQYNLCEMIKKKFSGFRDDVESFFNTFPQKALELSCLFIFFRSPFFSRGENKNEKLTSYSRIIFTGQTKLLSFFLFFFSA